MTKPSADIAERALLTSLIYHPDAFASVAELVHPDDFQGALHRAVYEAMLELDADGRVIDEQSIASRLEGRYTVSTVAALVESIPDIANVEGYARRVREAATLRQLQRHAAGLIESCRAPDADATGILAAAETALYGLTERQVATQWETAGKFAEANVKGLEAALNGTGAFMHAVPTGFKNIDRFIHGFRPGELCYLAARPSQGKTALALNMAWNMSRVGHSVAFLSVEMSGESLTLRLQSVIANVPLYRIRSCNVRNDMDAIVESARIIHRLPLFIDDGWNLKPVEMRAKLRKLKKDRGVEVVYVDYIGLMQDDEDEKKAYERVSAISKALKSMAKELQLPIVALAQLRRLPAGTKTQRPELSDLRDSGNLEQDADIVLFIHREEQHLLDKCPEEKKGKAELIVAKQRNGPVGLAKLAFISDYCRFADLEPTMVDVCQVGRDLAAGKD